MQESTDLFVDEAMLTGETFPVEKAVAVLRQRHRWVSGPTRCGWGPMW